MVVVPNKIFTLARATLATIVVDGLLRPKYIPGAAILRVLPDYRVGDKYVAVERGTQIGMMFAVDVEARGREIRVAIA